MPDYPFTVFSMLGALLCIEPAIFILKSSSSSRRRSWSGIFLLGWVFVYNILSFVDSIIWSGDNTDEWLDGKGYCDVSSNLKTIFPIGVLGSVIGICRFLISSIRENISQEENVLKGKCWRGILEDGFLGLFLPALFIILTFMVESSRYAIVGVLGCRSILDQSWLAIVLYFMWPVILGLVAAIYTGIHYDFLLS
jgi:pheromone a factor receptor